MQNRFMFFKHKRLIAITLTLLMLISCIGINGALNANGYTVDMYHGDYEWHIEGGSSIMLSELIDKLSVRYNSEGDTARLIDVSDVQNVIFSDSDLISIEKTGNDWRLTSLQAFDTVESLKIVLNDGNVIMIRVEDAATNAYYSVNSNLMGDIFVQVSNGEFITSLGDGNRHSKNNMFFKYNDGYEFVKVVFGSDTFFDSNWPFGSQVVGSKTYRRMHQTADTNKDRINELWNNAPEDVQIKAYYQPTADNRTIINFSAIYKNSDTDWGSGTAGGSVTGDNNYILSKSDAIALDKDSLEVKENLNVSATANSGYVFSGWYIKPSDDTFPTEKVSVDPNSIAISSISDHSKDTDSIELVAVFTKSIKIIYKATEGGFVSPESEDIIAGDSATGSIATANSGYWFRRWLDKRGSSVSTDPNFIPTGNKIYEGAEYTAQFYKQPTINLTSNYNNGDFYKVESGGTTNKTTSTKFTAEEGMTNSLIAVPKDGYYVEKIEVYKEGSSEPIDTLSQNPINKAYMKDMPNDSDYTFKVYYKPYPTVSVTKEGNGTVDQTSVTITAPDQRPNNLGSINNNNLNNYNDLYKLTGNLKLDKTVTATPEEGYILDGWYVGDQKISSDSILSVDAINNAVDPASVTEIKAVFKNDPSKVIINYEIDDENQKKSYINVGSSGNIYQNNGKYKVVVPIDDYTNADSAIVYHSNKLSTQSWFGWTMNINGDDIDISDNTVLKLSDIYSQDEFNALGGTEITFKAEVLSRYVFKLKTRVETTAGETIADKDAFTAQGYDEALWDEFDVLSHGHSEAGKNQLSTPIAEGSNLMTTNVTYNASAPEGWYIDHWEYREKSGADSQTIILNDLVPDSISKPRIHTVPANCKGITFTGNNGELTAVYRPVTYTIEYIVMDPERGTVRESDGAMQGDGSTYIQYFTDNYSNGQSVVSYDMSAPAKDGYSFVGWFVIGHGTNSSVPHPKRGDTEYNLYYENDIGKNLISEFNPRAQYDSENPKLTLYLFFNEKLDYTLNVGATHINMPDGNVIANYNTANAASTDITVDDSKKIGIITENIPAQNLEQQTTFATQQKSSRSASEKTQWGSMSYTVYGVPAPGYKFVSFQKNFDARKDYLGAYDTDYDPGTVNRYNVDKQETVTIPMTAGNVTYTDNLYNYYTGNNSDQNQKVTRIRFSPLTSGDLTALFEPNICTLHFYDNDGTTEFAYDNDDADPDPDVAVSGDSREFTHDTGYVYNVSYIPEKSGYIFKGWSKTSGATVPDEGFDAESIKTGVEYIYGKKASDEYVSGLWNDTDTYLYAVWEASQLTLEKKVTGNMGDKTYDFSFSIEVDGADDESFLLTKDGVREEKSLVNGKTEITLKDGETAIFTGLPLDKEITVTETDRLRHTVSFDIDDEGAADAPFDDPSAKITLTDSESNRHILIINDLDIPAPTGVNINSKPLIFLLIILLAAFIMLSGLYINVRIKRKR